MVELVESAAPGAPIPAAPSSALRRPDQRRSWRVDCRDLGNRESCLTVIADRNQVILVGPPGETAVLSAPQLDQLRVTLRKAAALAGRSW